MSSLKWEIKVEKINYEHEVQKRSWIRLNHSFMSSDWENEGLRMSTHFHQNKISHPLDRHDQLSPDMHEPFLACIEKVWKVLGSEALTGTWQFPKNNKRKLLKESFESQLKRDVRILIKILIKLKIVFKLKIKNKKILLWIAFI